MADEEGRIVEEQEPFMSDAEWSWTAGIFCVLATVFFWLIR